MSPIEIAPSCAPGMPGISNSGIPPEDCTSISISLSLSSPARSFFRNASLVAALALAPTSASSTRLSAACCALASTSLRFLSRVCVMAISTRSRAICSTSRPTYPTSVNLVASTLRNGASASRASRRAISVLPTPVGPIIRMFFGSTSSRSSGGSCWRRQRFLSAIATARLASSWPTIKRSSSETISHGLNEVAGGSGGELFKRDLVVGIDADLRRDRQRAPGDRLGVEPVDLDQGAGRRERVPAARADADDAVLRFEHVAIAREDQRDLRVGDRHHRFQPAQIAVGAPILGQFDAGPGQLPGILFELGFEPFKQCDRVDRRPGEPGDDAAA